MGFSMGYKDKNVPVTEETSQAVIERSIELGSTFLDTSDRYGAAPAMSMHACACTQQLSCSSYG